MKKFDNTVIVTDLDGTFLNDDEGLVERNLEAIEYFKQNGGKFTVATGRVAKHALGAIPNVAQLVNMPAVTCNGACLYDFRSDTVCALYPMRQELVMEIVGYVRENFPSVGIRAGAHEYCFLSTPEDIENPYIAGDFRRYSSMKCLVAPLSEWSRLPILKIVLRADDGVMDKISRDLPQHFGAKISACKSWGTIVDVEAGGINKGSTLREYVRANMPQSTKIYACGDYINDTELLREADVAVCPSGAHGDIRKICDLCLCSNNDGLIADLVEHIEKSI